MMDREYITIEEALKIFSQKKEKEKMKIELDKKEIEEIIKCMEMTEGEYASCDWDLLEKLKKACEEYDEN